MQQAPRSSMNYRSSYKSRLSASDLVTAVHRTLRIGRLKPSMVTSGTSSTTPRSVRGRIALLPRLMGIIAPRSFSCRTTPGSAAAGWRRSAIFIYRAEAAPATAAATRSDYAASSSGKATSSPPSPASPRTVSASGFWKAIIMLGRVDACTSAASSSTGRSCRRGASIRRVI